jgi:hypothetical protein
MLNSISDICAAYVLTAAESGVCGGSSVSMVESVHEKNLLDCTMHF